MDLYLHSKFIFQNASIKIGGSKSETNRLYLLQRLYPNIILDNTSLSDDSVLMQKALQGNESVIDIHHAGTAMRFLTAYFAIQEDRQVILTGSERMKIRPIKILVGALRQLGADITYLENEGFPPLKITGKKLTKNKVSLDANTSSQYASALLLIAPKLENGIELTLYGEITSAPYLNMTLQLLKRMGMKTTFINNVITVLPHFKADFDQHLKFVIESDWSSASYFYALVALSKPGTQIMLANFKKDSFQGDSVIVHIYKSFGVHTFFDSDVITIRKEIQTPKPVNLNLQDTPDLAQTVAVTAFGLGVSCHLSGLHTLKIKETDRLQALQTELTKLGAKIKINKDSLTLGSHFLSFEKCPEVKIATYNDHRMAMAFATLAVKFPISIENAGVVSKSYPRFWEDLKSIGIQITELP